MNLLKNQQPAGNIFGRSKNWAGRRDPRDQSFVPSSSKMVDAVWKLEALTRKTKGLTII